MDPWSRTTSRVPAASCKPSTFCVTSVKPGSEQLQRASTSWARFGRHRAMRLRRHEYHSHTRRGSCANAWGVARSSGLNRRQSPSAPRNVGTPLAADTPAPVSTVTRRAFEMRAASSARAVISVEYVLPAAECHTAPCDPEQGAPEIPCLEEKLRSTRRPVPRLPPLAP